MTMMFAYMYNNYYFKKTIIYLSIDIYKKALIIIVPLILYDPGGGALKPPPPIFCPHGFNFGATLLCVGDFSQKIV